MILIKARICVRKPDPRSPSGCGDIFVAAATERGFVFVCREFRGAYRFLLTSSSG